MPTSSRGTGRRPLGQPLDILQWNVGQSSRVLEQLLDRRDAFDVAILQEASHLCGLLDLHLRRTHIVRRVHHPASDHSSDLVLAISRDIPRPVLTPRGHTTAWKGPKVGNRKTGRSVALLDWTDLRLVGVHRTAGGPEGGSGPHTRGSNRGAWDADLTIIRRAEHRPKPFALIGDQNAAVDELDEYRALGLHLTRSPCACHVAARGVRVELESLGKHGSDHHLQHIHLTPKESR